MATVPWLTLTIANLATAKAAALVEALRTAALADGQQDPLPAIIARVTTRIRTEIAAGGNTVLSADPAKIPPSLESIGLRMVLREGQGRLNAIGAAPLSDDERKEWDKDDRYLERIAEGRITVESPDDPQPTPTVQSKTTRPRITPRPSLWDRASQDGI